MTVSVQRVAAATMAAVVMMAAGPVVRAGDRAAECEAMLADKTRPLVTLKFVLKMKGGFFGGDEENESETTGLMIDAKGLVLCSNTMLGGFASFVARFGEGMSVTPTDIKVLIGDDTEGVEAKLMARDSELDLAWIEINEPAEEGYTFVNFGEAAKPKLGERVLCVRRMGKFFDRVPALAEGYVAGFIRKPRELYVPAGGLIGNLGLPIYTAQGRVIGLMVTQMPDADEMEMNPSAMLGSITGLLDMFGGVILPADQVVQATKRARETAKENEEEPEGEQEQGDEPAKEDGEEGREEE